MKQTLDRWRPRVDETLEQLLPRRVDTCSVESWFGRSAYAYDVTAVQRGFVDPVWDLFDRGGNRWRAGLFLALLEGLGHSPRDHFETACVVELLHKGALIADDIEDDADMRLHEPPIHEVYGTDVAVNAASFCYAFGQNVLLSDPTDLGQPIRDRLLAATVVELNHLHLGQTIDIQWQDRTGDDVSLDEYRQLCACKTGCLFRLATRMAAAIAGVPDRTRRRLLRGAEELAITFQITDDRLDAYHSIHETDHFGKERGNDVIEGKVTPLVIHALDVAEPADRCELQRILTTDSPSAAEVETALGILDETDSLAFARECAAEHATHARAAFRGVSDLDADAIARVEAFVDFAETGEW